MSTQIEIIDADKALMLLRGNTRNRPLNEQNVALFAQQMKDGRWQFNGDTICLSSDGTIIDGQNRLHAVVRSGVPLKAIVVRDLPFSVFDTKDIGRRRTHGDTLAILGHKNTHSLAATLALIERYMTGRVTTNSARFSNHEIADLARKYPDAAYSVTRCATTRKLAPQRVLMACHYLFSRLDKNAADKFVDDLISGRNLEQSDPVFILRERLMNNALSKAKLNAEYIMALIIKAWNFRRSGANVSCLRYRQEGDNPEEFPIVR